MHLEYQHINLGPEKAAFDGQNPPTKTLFFSERSPQEARESDKPWPALASRQRGSMMVTTAIDEGPSNYARRFLLPCR